jgi:hypothetical protein
MQIKFNSFNNTFQIRRIQEDININLHGSSGKVRYPCHTRILIKLEYFIDTLSNNPQMPNFIKIRPVRAELFYADRHDRTNSRLSQFCERA